MIVVKQKERAYVKTERYSFRFLHMSSLIYNMVKDLPLVAESQSVTGSIDVNHNRFVPVDFLS